ncbi:hypothetical protein K493DRAFT_78864 [Basidiobolus meristosporus CBS 931.73]|uniref:Uncharacterized protein n=1 Tax=Basidiobolus meristosporus CBS 931.73 TaxID=1314790 RepID=A0A1Y1XRL0_9FUNG|nr:hypothetical protein K493DRAFT_78864 [Basidiobolus meristosporus CBS 931.73]|eukprot:ORX88380.1 hypothetical protein K493DRAFT_78864 [Basidiobolus meristosporus CBS 931.73]
MQTAHIPTLSSTMEARLADPFRYQDKESWGISQERRCSRNTRYRVAFIRKAIISRTKSPEYLKSRASRLPLKQTRKRRFSSELLLYSLEKFSKRAIRSNLKVLVESQAGSLQTPQDRPDYLYSSSISLNPNKSKYRPISSLEPNPTTAMYSPVDSLFVKVKPVEVSQVSLLSRMIQTRQSSLLEKNAERRRLLKAMRRHSVDVSGGEPDLFGSQLLTDLKSNAKRRYTPNRSQLRMEEGFFDASLNVW